MFICIVTSIVLTHPASTQAAAVATPRVRIVVFGDSLSASYGLSPGAGWVNLLEKRLTAITSASAPDYQVINTSISGETTLGGRNRIEQVLRTHRPDVVVLALGANDGLRGASMESMQQNLAAMIQLCRKAGARVLLVGMQLPPNYGAAYTSRFHAVYGQLVKQHQSGFVPFLLEGIGEKREFFQSDGLHPNAAAQPLIEENIWKELKKLLRL